MDDQLTEILLEYLDAVDRGDPIRVETLVSQHPAFATELREFFAGDEIVEQIAMPLREAVESTVTRSARLCESLQAEPPRHLGPYQLLGEIGRGGMGVVYKARHTKLNRQVALKTILSGAFASAADLERFQREAESAAALDHPNITPIYDVGQCDGHAYYAMKLVEGTDLSTSPSRNTEQSVRWMKSVCNAVHFAHQRQILHRDLKPANVLLDADDNVVVCDFGLSRRLEASVTASNAGDIVGTPQYMAPEQVTGGKHLTTAADVYGLGAILYELLTGQPPFFGSTPLETLRMVVDEAPHRPRSINSSIDRDLETICLTCLRKDPDARYGSAAAVSEDLDRWLEKKPIAARPTPTIEACWKWMLRNPALALSAAVICLSVCAVVLTLWRSNAAISSALSERTNALNATRTANYFQTIALCDRDTQLNESGRIQQLLNSCPDDQRNWEWHYLRRRWDSATRQLPLSYEPTAIAVHPTENLFATAGGELGDPATIEIRDAATGRVLRVVHSGSPGDTDDGRPDVEAPINRIEFSPNGTHLAVASARVALVYDVESSELIAVDQIYDAEPHCVAFDQASTMLAMGYSDGAVRIGGLVQGAKFTSIQKHEGAVRTLAFARSGTSVFSAGDDLAIRRTETQTRDVFKFSGHRALVRNLCISADDRLLASASYDGTARLWDIETGAELIAVRGHKGFVTDVAFLLSEQYLATSGIDRTIRITDVRTGEELNVERGHNDAIWDICVDDASSRIISVGGEPRIRFWRSEPLYVSPVRLGIEHQWSHLRVCRITGRVFVVENETEILALDRETRSRQLVSTARQLVRNMAISQDGETIAVQRGLPYHLQVRRVDTGDLICSLEEIQNELDCIAVSPLGRFVAASVPEVGVRTWEIPSAQVHRTFLSQKAVSEIRFAGDGSHVALRSDGHANSVLVFEMATGEQVLSTATSSSVLAIDHRGSRLAICEPDAYNFSILSIDSSGDDTRVACKGHLADVTALAFNRAADRIVSAARDGVVKLWDVQSGREILTLKSLFVPVRELFFSADGYRIYATDGHTSVQLWDGAPQRSDVR